MPNQKPKLPELFYHLKTGTYYMRLEAARRFIPLDGRTCKLEMMKRGFYIDTEIKDTGLKAGDNELLTAQLENYVDYAGPLAGYPIGMFATSGGKRVLVTSETRPIEPKKGRLEWINRFIDNLLSNSDGQVEYLLLWLKFALESVSDGTFRPLPMLVLAGEAGCGKSFLQLIITEFVGGRSAKPWSYLSGETRFNSHLAGAEHHYMEDEGTGLDLRTRRKFGEGIKQETVTELWNVEGKNQEAVTLGFCRVCTMSVNNEPEKLSVLPPMDGDIADKIALLLCSKVPLSHDRKANWEAMKRELPALAYFVVNMKVPKHLADERYGVATFHHPDLMQMLAGVSPELRLLEFIDQWIFTRRQGETHEKAKERMADGFRGGTIVLEQELSSSPFNFQVQKLLSHSSTCGTYLARLKKKFPDRFDSKTNGGKTVWYIKQESQ